MGTAHHHGGPTAEDLHLYSITLEYIQYDLIKMIAQSPRKNNWEGKNLFVNSCGFNLMSQKREAAAFGVLMPEFIKNEPV